MDYTETLKSLLDYYANLLIVQYNGKPKASATIKMLANLILAGLVILQIRDGYTLEAAEFSINNYVADSPGIEDVFINKFVFQKQIDNQGGDYVFYYNGSNWILNTSTVTLSDYGIKTQGTVKSGDTITVKYTPYTAVGNPQSNITGQLDIIGKWVGVSRDYKGSLYWNNTFLSYPRADQLTPTDLTDSLQHGYSDYDTFDTDTGGVLTYDNLGFVEQSLGDDDYRVVIGLKIIQNNLNHTCKNIDDAIWRYFGGEVYTTWQPHEITYHYPESMSEIINVCNYKNVLLAPAGVSISLSQIS